MPDIQDYPKIYTWALNASDRGGTFVSTFAKSVLCSDAHNFAILLPVIERMIEKYPAYSGRTTDERQGDLL